MSIIAKLKELSRFLGDKFVLSPKITHFKNADVEMGKKNILVIGVVLEDRVNHYEHISSVFSNSNTHNVEQVWAVLKGNKKLASVTGVKHVYSDDFVPRSSLINSLLEPYLGKDYDYIMITDDDIRLPKDFVDQFLVRQEQYDFALAQPARTPDSIISHWITKQNKRATARRTQFVEIGPLVSIRNDIQDLILPLDTDSPMGWGLDYVWPYDLLANNKKMGIIDCVPIAHTLRETGKSYSSAKALEQMNDYLQSKPHLSVSDSHVVIDEFSK